METTNKSKLKLLQNLHNLPKIAKDNNWQFFYDSELDYLYYSEKNLPKEAKLLSLNDEISFYVTPNHDVKGIFIEYLQNNFLQHQKAFKKMKQFFKKSGKFKKSAESEIYKDAFMTHVLTNLPDNNLKLTT